MRRALQARARTIEFGHAGDVETFLDAQPLLEAPPHLVGVGLGPENHFAQLHALAQIALVDLLSQKQSHGGGGAQAGGTHVLKQLEVDLHVARPHRQGHGPEMLAAQLEAGPGRPQAVAHGDLHPVQGGQAGQLVAASEHLLPGVDVALGVGQYLALAGGAGRGVDAHHLGLGHGQKRQGIALAQILDGGQRQPGEVVQGQVLAGLVAGLGQALPVDRAAGKGVAAGPVEAGGLDVGDGLGGKIGQKTVCRHGRLRVGGIGGGFYPKTAIKKTPTTITAAPGRRWARSDSRKTTAPRSTPKMMLRRLTAMT